MDTTSHPPPSPTSSDPPLTHHNTGHTPHESNPKDDDSAVFIAATQLLELSKTQPINGVVTALQICRQKSHLNSDPPSLPPSNNHGLVRSQSDSIGEETGKDMVRKTAVHVCPEEGERKGEKGEEVRVNGFDDVGEGEAGNKESGREEECAMEEGEGRVENGEVVSGDCGDTVISETTRGEKVEPCYKRKEQEVEMDTSQEGVTSEDVKKEGTSNPTTFGQ